MLAGLFFLCIFGMVFYGLTMLLRQIFSVSASYSSQHMAVGCIITPLLSIAGFMVLNWACQSINSLLHHPDYLFHEFAFSLIAVPLLWHLRYGRNKEPKTLKDM